MESQIVVLLIIIGVSLILFVSELVPVEVTALVVMTTLMVTGIVSLQEGISGFSNPATITILALLLLSEGIRQSGTVDLFSQHLFKAVSRYRLMLFPIIVIIPAFLSAFINNTAVVAIFIPVYIQIAQRMNISPSLLLMPLSFACMAGGSTTLIGSSTNLLANSVAADYGATPFAMFDFTAVGFVLVIVLVLFMTFFAKRLIPQRKNVNHEMTRNFETKEYITEVMVGEDSPVTKVDLKDTILYKSSDIGILSILRGKDKKWLPDEVERLQNGDIIVIQSERKRLLELIAGLDISIHSTEVINDDDLTQKGGILAEILVGPSSQLAGKTLRSVDFRNRYGAVPLAIQQTKKHDSHNFLDRKLVFGDVILVQTKNRNIDRFQNNTDVILLDASSSAQLIPKQPDSFKIALSVMITIGVVLLASFQILSMLIAAWLGCVTMMITGCLDAKKSFQNIPWSVFFLLAGIIPLGIAMQNTGTAELLADLLLNVMEGWGIHAIVLVLYLITILLTSIMSNNATAILITPIAIQIAITSNLPPQALLLTVLLGANSSFLTPIGYQTNTMIYKSGSYRFTDFTKVGGILTVLYIIAVVIIVPMWAGIS